MSHTRHYIIYRRPTRGSTHENVEAVGDSYTQLPPRVYNESNPFIKLAPFVEDLSILTYHDNGVVELVDHESREKKQLSPKKPQQSARDLLLLIFNPYKVPITGGVISAMQQQDFSDMQSELDTYVTWYHGHPKPKTKTHGDDNIIHHLNPYTALDLEKVYCVTYYNDQRALLTYFKQPNESKSNTVELLPTLPHGLLELQVLLLNNFGNQKCFGTLKEEIDKEALLRKYASFIRQTKRYKSNGAYKECKDTKGLIEVLMRVYKKRISDEERVELSEEEQRVLAVATLDNGGDIPKPIPTTTTTHTSMLHPIVKRASVTCKGEAVWQLRKQYFIMIEAVQQSRMNTYFEEFVKKHPTFEYVLGFVPGQSKMLLCFDEKGIILVKRELAKLFGRSFGPTLDRLSTIKAPQWFRSGEGRSSMSFSSLQADEMRRQNVRTLKATDLRELASTAGILDKAKAHLIKRDKMVSLSMERWVKDTRKILEIGMCLWPVNGEKLHTFHWVVKENWTEDMHNTHVEHDRYKKFLFGAPEKMPLDDILRLVSHFCDEAKVVIGHNIKTHIAALRQAGCVVSPPHIDLQTLAIATHGVHDMQSLPSLMTLTKLGTAETVKSLHIAGNDAHYAMQIFRTFCT